MSIFKRKTKGEKVATEKAKKESKADGKKPARADKPTQERHAQPYKPTHAAADAIRKPVAVNGSRHLSKNAADYAQGGAGFQHPLVHNGNLPFAQAGSRSGAQGPNPLPSYQGYKGGFSSMQRNNSAEVFTTDPDAPPMPRSFKQGHGNTPPTNGSARNSSWYSSQPRENTSPFDTPMLGNPKMAAAARDRGYLNTQTSGDSGYGSTSHSRAPSEQMNHYELSKPHLPRDEGGFLPELSLSEELATEPAFSEASFGGDDSTEQAAMTPKQPEGVLKTSKGYPSQLDLVNDSRSIQSTKSHRTVPKQTRFEQEYEDRPAKRGTESLDLHRPASSRYSQSQYLPEVFHDTRPESATLPQTRFSQPAEMSMLPLATDEDPTPSFSIPPGRSSPPPQRQSESHSQYRGPPLPPMRFSSPPPQHAANFAPLERIISPSLMSNQTSTGTLEGLKVNKRGKILNEEGEITGELVEGDMMDCVRQRCNGYGEVLNDRGRIVGRVQPLEQSLESPIMRMALPGPSPAPLLTQENYFSPQAQQVQQPPPREPASSRRKQSRREPTGSHPDVFTPAWQRRSENTQASQAWELRNHLAASHPRSRRPITPADFPDNVTAIELDASGLQSDSEEEYEEEYGEDMMPIFDHSEIFMPVPVVPPRSLKRSETPSPPKEKQWAASQLIRPASPTPVEHESQDYQRASSRCISAPPRQPLIAQQGQTKPWAAAAQKTLASALATTPEHQQQDALVGGSQTPSSRTLPIVAIAMAPPTVPQVNPVPMTIAASAPPIPADLQRQPAAAQAPEPEPTRRTSFQSASNSSMSDAAKSYSRPSMRPAPEDGDAASNTVSQGRNSGLFSYKGEIPASDGSASNASLAASRAPGVKSQPLPTFPRQASTGGLPGGNPFAPMNAPMNSAQFASGGGLTPRATPLRQFTSGVPAPRQILPNQQKSSFNTPLKRSPLSSHGMQPTVSKLPDVVIDHHAEITPPDSEQGFIDGDTTIGVASGMHSRQPFLNSMRSTATGRKSRTYFTHAGRVAVADNEPPPSRAGSGHKKPEKEATPSILGVSTKKKSRFSLGVGRKVSAAIVAH
ncbi:hypothetical protein LTS00_017532 [Friedmanniomyces endolithicus]|nr:hypothetical protein LTS00_017532 [Friedmanniomyces endolithicus]